MRKTLWFFLLFSFSIPFQAKIIKDTTKYQNNPVRAIHELPVRDSVPVPEKVYLHTDRTIYFAGDDIWIKAYLIEASEGLPSGLSNNLHVELISPASQIISSGVIRIESGLGNGDFKLPGDIKSGRYLLRAYTNYMRNFGEQLFFTKELTVINPADETKPAPEKSQYVENKIQISFFPEGGSLVDNVSSIVAFKAVNSQGKGCDVAGRVFSSAGDLITTFRSSHLGMGSFFLRPLPGLRYYSIFRGADSIDIRTDLPASFAAGVNLGVSVNTDDLLITVKTNPQTLQLVSVKNLKLDFSIRKEVIKTIQFRIKDLLTNFKVPTFDLPDGIVMVSLSAQADLPLAERLFYNQKEDPLFIRIETDKHSYKTREPVALKLSISDDSITERNASVSLAVVDNKLTDKNSEFPTNISSWFLLESDVRGYIEDPSYYFDPSNHDRLRDLDLLLRTQGWRDFQWKYDTVYFPAENGFTVSGRLKRNVSGRAIEDFRVSVVILAKGTTFFKNVKVDSLGKFQLPDIQFSGEARLIVTGIDKKDRLKGTLLLDSMIYVPAEIPERQPEFFTRVENNLDELKTRYKIYETIQKRYKLTDTIGLGEVNIIAEKHKDFQTIKIESSRLKYIKPEAELVVTEQMLGYNSILHLLSGKIPGVVVMGDTSVVIRGYGSLAAIKPPLILIDGNPAMFGDLSDMPIPMVDRIDVLKSTFATNIYGFQGSSGVINIITKAGGVLEAYKPVDYSVSVKVSGYSAARVFYSPQHLPESDSVDKPDQRSTLFWNPDINVESKKEVRLNYYNGDNSSIFRIEAEGLTSTGIPVTGKAEYEVR